MCGLLAEDWGPLGGAAGLAASVLVRTASRVSAGETQLLDVVVAAFQEGGKRSRGTSHNITSAAFRWSKQVPGPAQDLGMGTLTPSFQEKVICGHTASAGVSGHNY